MEDQSSYGTPSLGKTRFTKYLIRHNALDVSGFKEWVFCPGMLFNSLDKWWGAQGRRDRPHEGLDLCLYRDRGNRIRRLEEKTKVPVMYDGVVVAILNDFLGKSVIIEHDLRYRGDIRFCSIYGHADPPGDLRFGTVVKEGDIIASLADARCSRSHIFPHLHISIGWIPKGVSYDKLDWETIGSPDTMTLLDPLHAIDCNHTPLARALPPCEDLLKAAKC